MKKFLILSIITICILLFSSISEATVYSCVDGRLKIGALQTNLQSAKVCSGSTGVDYMCTGGSRMTSLVTASDPKCALIVMRGLETPKTKLTVDNFNLQLSNYFSVKETSCNGIRCTALVDGLDVTQNVINNFEGYRSFEEHNDGSGNSALMFTLFGDEPAPQPEPLPDPKPEPGCSPFPECKLY